VRSPAAFRETARSRDGGPASHPRGPCAGRPAREGALRRIHSDSGGSGPGIPRGAPRSRDRARPRARRDVGRARPQHRRAPDRRGEGDPPTRSLRTRTESARRTGPHDRRRRAWRRARLPSGDRPFRLRARVEDWKGRNAGTEVGQGRATARRKAATNPSRGAERSPAASEPSRPRPRSREAPPLRPVDARSPRAMAGGNRSKTGRPHWRPGGARTAPARGPRWLRPSSRGSPQGRAMPHTECGRGPQPPPAPIRSPRAGSRRKCRLPRRPPAARRRRPPPDRRFGS
jgi:hypothetical protein